MPKLLIPVFSADKTNSKIAPLSSYGAIAQMVIDDRAKMISLDFFETIKPLLNEGGYLIVDNHSQDIEEMLNFDIEVLLTTPMATIEDIHEQFIFKTLQEVR